MRFYKPNSDIPVDPTYINFIPTKNTFEILIRHGFYDEHTRKFGHPLIENFVPMGELEEEINED